MVQLPLSVVQQGHHVAEVATERSVGIGLVGKTLMVDLPVVLIMSAQQLVEVVVDEARDSMLQNAHHAISPSALSNLEDNLLGSGRGLLPADLANDEPSHLAGALIEEVVASHLGARSSKSVGQLHEVALKNDRVLVGTNLTVSNGVVRLHKFLR
jgi:hypothetical protein